MWKSKFEKVTRPIYFGSENTPFLVLRLYDAVAI